MRGDSNRHAPASRRWPGPACRWAARCQGWRLEEDEVASLRTLNIKAADIRFLNLMIAHHRGGVHMAQAALELDVTEPVRRLARAIVKSQSAEIDAMADMLRELRQRRHESTQAFGTELGTNGTGFCDSVRSQTTCVRASLPHRVDGVSAGDRRRP